VDKLIKDSYVVDEDKLLIKSEENEYWKRCANFWKKIKNKKESNLSATQRDWLDKIVDELEE